MKKKPAIDLLTKDQMWCVCQQLTPATTRHEFEKMWLEFVARKRWGLLGTDHRVIVQTESQRTP